jgi:hypothetical protein
MAAECWCVKKETSSRERLTCTSYTACLAAVLAAEKGPRPDFPPWEAVYAFYERWNSRGLPHELIRRMRGLAGDPGDSGKYFGLPRS